jgi:hypothetical protein
VISKQKQTIELLLSILEKDPLSVRDHAGLVVPKETIDTWSDEKVVLYEALMACLVFTGKEAPQEYIDRFKEMK